MADTTRTPPHDGTPRRAVRRGSGPAFREAIWGFVFIGPWLIGLAAVHGRPDRRLVRHVAHELRPASRRRDALHRHRQLRPDDERSARRARRSSRHSSSPSSSSRSRCSRASRFALLMNHPRLAGKGVLRTLVYMPIMIPLVASTLVWTGFLNTETGWLNKILRTRRHRRARTGSAARCGSTRRSP